MDFAIADQIGERQRFLSAFLYNSHQQVGNEGAINLYLDRVLVVAKRVFQREVLLELFEQ